jgi:hypothetical protein
MRHHASRAFWEAYRRLPEQVRALADKNYSLLKDNPRHSSLRLKKVGDFWSVRVGVRHRALATEVDGEMVWFWIGSHADYDALIGEPHDAATPAPTRTGVALLRRYQIYKLAICASG